MLNLDEHKPETLEAAIALLFDDLEPEDSAYIKENGAESAHHTAGRALRNAWLWNKDHPLHQHFNTRFGLGHADDMSNLILEGLTAKVRGVEYDPTPTVERCKEHWRRNNIDPLTQESTKPA